MLVPRKTPSACATASYSDSAVTSIRVLGPGEVAAGDQAGKTIDPRRDNYCGAIATRGASLDTPLTVITSG